jgi:hypothetical protein
MFVEVCLGKRYTTSFVLVVCLLPRQESCTCDSDFLQALEVKSNEVIRSSSKLVVLNGQWEKN